MIRRINWFRASGLILVVMSALWVLWLVVWAVSASASTIEAPRVVGAEGQPSYENSCKGFGSGYGSAVFWKDPAGLVHIEGEVEYAGAPGAEPCFMLPSGYRPQQASQFSSVAGAGGAVEIETNGEVREAGGTAHTVSLNGITFRPTGADTWPEGEGLEGKEGKEGTKGETGLEGKEGKEGTEGKEGKEGGGGNIEVGVYSTTATVEAGVVYEPCPTQACDVIVRATYTGGTENEAEISVNGVSVTRPYHTSSYTFQTATYTFMVPIAGKWEWKDVEGTVAELKETHAELKGTGGGGGEGGEGKEGKEGKEGAKGENGPKGENGAEGKEGKEGAGKEGAEGKEGKAGSAGIPGEEGKEGKSGKSFIWSGSWSPSVGYAYLHVTLYNGSSYIDTLEVGPSIVPPSEDHAHWELMAERGSEGKTGPEGKEGKEGTGKEGPEGKEGKEGIEGEPGAEGKSKETELSRFGTPAENTLNELKENEETLMWCLIGTLLAISFGFALYTILKARSR